MHSGVGRLLLTARLGMAPCGEGIPLVPPTGGSRRVSQHCLLEAEFKAQ